MKSKKLLSGCLALMITLSAMSFTPFAQEKQLAFPCAEGGGMYSQGARASSNFTVYHVTNLYDSGSGSFRDAVSQGNRIIVFDVAGNIMLESSLQIRSSNLTILGQTAPGEGICVGGNDVRFSNANNIIMRYMRFRMGDISDSQEDGLGVRNCTEVILDHCSVSWSIDECLSAYENKNFTAQYCIISESLNQSHHAKGDHGYGGIWGGTNASFHHNLIATHNSRTPRIGTNQTVHSYNDRPDYESLIDVRNNVIYNWGNQSAYGGELNTRVNFVNNYYKPTAISKVKYIYDIYRGDNITGYTGTTLHVSGNVMEGEEGITNDNWTGVAVHYDDTSWTKCESISDGYTDESGKLWANDQYIHDYPVNTTDANTAYNDVLDKAGASHFRDEIDTRVINDVRNGTMPTGSKSGEGLIDSQNDVGGWVSLYGQKPEDKDNDGMADQWERANGLDTSKNDSTAIASNGYTNIENYAESILETEYEGYEADSSLLKAEIDIAKALIETDYSREDWEMLQGKIAMAELTYFKSAPTQAELDNAYKNLKDFVDSLAIDHSDLLKNAIQRAKSIDLNRYTKESVDILNQAVAKGEADLEAGNSDSYKADAEAIDSAIEGLKEGYKVKLKKLIDFVNAMDLSNITYESKMSIKEQLDKAQTVYKDTDATKEDTDSAIQTVYDIVAQGNYNTLKKGRVVDEVDFENGYNDEFIFSMGGSYVENPISIVKGYGTNNTNVITLKDNYDDIIDGIRNFGNENEALSHYIISCDVIFESPTYINLLGHSDGLYPKYSFEYNPRGWDAKADQKWLNDEDYNGFMDLSRWTELALEIDRDNGEITYYINKLPVFRSEYKDDNYSYGFMLGNKAETVYYDNFTVTDMTESSSSILGDVDCDGDVDAADVSCLLNKVLSGGETIIEQSMGSSAMQYIDMDCNGVIDSADVAQLLQKILDSSYKTPADRNFEITTENISEESTEITTEESTETTTADPNIIYYPVEGGEILINRADGTVTGYNGSPTNVIIPSEAEGVTVSAISPIAFRYSRTLESIYIPSTIKTIAEGTFQNLGLRTVTIENGVETIERRAFQYTAIGEITIPASVRTIGDYAFMGCMNLRNVVIEDGVEEIGRDAFGMCGFDSILIPDSVTSIGKWSQFKATILCHEGSYAQQYAIDNNYKYEIIQ